ncbi:DMT family transporter [Novosphingobium sp. LASN5T]|uniref:DMT family transporter n=1 Tax=Novosphingobium sp. LASN5T TaxID=2491021 RepID=UPI000F5F614C|nr:EamA family transporter [Novosphingobium sp. LASN5T]RQW42347.1 EamA family transporter [Novosphingobium sp. LASN5T]
MTSPNGGPASFWSPRILGPFALVALIWGSTWLVIKDQIGSVPASWSVTWRFAVAAVGVLLLALARRESLRLDRRGHQLAVLMGLLQFACNFQFVYRAEQHITSGIVAVLFALLLVPNALFARLFLGQPLTRGFLAGSAIAIAGIALLLLHEVRTAPVGNAALLGVLFTFCGILSASSANVLQASEAARTRPMLALLFWAMVWGVAIDALFAWMVYGPPQIDMRPGYLLGIAYLGVMGSVVTFPLYFQLVRELGPGRAAYNGVVVPVVAMLLSTLFEGYRWSSLAVAGAVLAMAGLIVALRARNPSR